MQIAVNCWSIFFLWSYRTWCSYSLSVLMAFYSYPFSIYLKFSVFLCAFHLCFLGNFYLTTNSQILWASKKLSKRSLTSFPFHFIALNILFANTNIRNSIVTNFPLLFSYLFFFPLSIHFHWFCLLSIGF